MQSFLQFCGCATPPVPVGFEPKEGPAKSVHAGDINNASLKIEGDMGKKIGYFSNHGWEQKASMFGVGKKDVRPKINQDRLVVTPNLAGDPNAIMFACYDGNGPKGDLVAEMAAHEIIKAFGKESPEVFKGDLGLKTKGIVTLANRAIVEKSFAHASGSTATIVIVHGAKVMCANVGDSRAIRVVEDVKGEWISDCIITEHLPELEEEKKRIEECGGHVLIDKENFGAPRVFDNEDPIGQMVAMMDAGGSDAGGGMGAGMAMAAKPWPGLAMSRVLGHAGVEKIGITSMPDVHNYNLTVADKAIVVCSDGVWDFIEDEEVTKVIKHFAPDAEAAAKSLVETAEQRWIEDDPTYRDDISACVIYLPLGEGELASADSVVFTQQSAAAVAEAKDAENKPAAEVGAAAAGGAPPMGGLKDADIKIQTEGAKKPDEDAAARRKRIKASKEQMRRSVNVSYG